MSVGLKRRGQELGRLLADKAAAEQRRAALVERIRKPEPRGEDGAATAKPLAREALSPAQEHRASDNPAPVVQTVRSGGTADLRQRASEPSLLRLCIAPKVLE